MTTETLINKFRPERFDQVLGHEEMLAALQRSLKESTHPHAFLFTGPSGVGKTTIARIIAKELKTEVLELDAATNSGVAEMRELNDLATHVPLSGAGKRMVIIDECHALSKNAWQTTLKLLEEPPPHLYIALCTTEVDKVPQTVKTRCFHVVLRPVKPRDIEDLLLVVSELEEWKVDPEVLREVVRASDGSPRKALSILQVVHGVTSKEEVRRVIDLIDAGEATIELAQLLLSGKTDWAQVRAGLQAIADDEFDGAKIHLGRYFAGAMLRSESEKQAKLAWQLLDALLFPTSTLDAKAAFYCAVGRVLWG